MACVLFILAFFFSYLLISLHLTYSATLAQQLNFCVTVCLFMSYFNYSLIKTHYSQAVRFSRTRRYFTRKCSVCCTCIMTKTAFDLIWSGVEETSVMLVARQRQVKAGREPCGGTYMCCFYTQQYRLDKHVADSQAEEQRFAAQGGEWGKLRR